MDLVIQIRSDQSLSCVRLFATPWIAACQASLSITNSRSSPRLTSIESVMPSSHLILCRLLLLLPPIPPGIRVFSNESTLRMRWPKYWSLLVTYNSPKCISTACPGIVFPVKELDSQNVWRIWYPSVILSICLANKLSSLIFKRKWGGGWVNEEQKSLFDLELWISVADPNFDHVSWTCYASHN